MRSDTRVIGTAPVLRTHQPLLDGLRTSFRQQSLRVGQFDLNLLRGGVGPPVLLLHGANLGWPQWYKNLDCLADSFELFALELPGAGGSSRLRFATADLEHDFVDVVDETVATLGLNSLHVVAHSFGGWIALRLALRRRPYLRRIVLANPLGFTKYMPLQFRPISIELLARLMSRTALRPIRSNARLEQFMRDPLYQRDVELSVEFVDYFYELSETSHNALFISRLAGLRGLSPELFLGEALHRVRQEVLVIWGEEDPLMPYGSVEASLRLLPNGTVQRLPGVGHIPPVEAPAEFNRLTREFLLAAPATTASV